MLRTILVLSALALSTTLPAPAAAHHECDRPMDPSAGGFFLPPQDDCAGAAIGLGPEFRCPGTSAHAGPVWVAVLRNSGCTVGVVVVLP